MKVVFSNPGVIDVEAFRVFGMSAKESPNPIGYFGTGLKYAIAILVRTGHKVTLLAGSSSYDFTLDPISFRGREFDGILMSNLQVEEDRVKLPFTTQLGRNWEVWMAFRELACNAMDEGGKYHAVDSSFVHDENCTDIIVEGAEIEKAWNDRKNIFLSLPPDQIVNNDTEVDIYNTGSSGVFYRGIRVMPTDRPALFTYNMKCHVVLTEDRTVSIPSMVKNSICLAICRLQNEKLIRKAITAPQGSEEHGLNFHMLNFYTEFWSPEFEKVLTQEFETNNDNLNPSLREVFSSYKSRHASKHYEPSEPTEVERKQLKRAREICSLIFDDFGDYEIMIVKTLGQQTMALADFDTRTMVVSRSAFLLGTKFLVSTLLEEYAHLKTGHGDETRALQTWLFDQICTIAENHILKEPM